MITKIAYVTRAKMGMKVTGKRMYKSSQLIFLSLLGIDRAQKVVKNLLPDIRNGIDDVKRAIEGI